MPHTPQCLRLLQENSTLRVGHNAALGKVAEFITSALGIGAIAFTASFEQCHGFFNGIDAAYPQITTIETVYPCSLIALIRNQCNTYLRDGNRQRIMHQAGAITCFNTTVKEQSPVNTFKRGNINSITAR